MEMVRNIREHVRLNGHVVVASDNPMGQALGYQCLSCLQGEFSRTRTWHVAAAALRGCSGVEGLLLGGALGGGGNRGRLTDYLNGVGEFSPVTPPEVVRMSRYKRPWVI